MATKSSLSFLRPLALPRSSTVHSFFQGYRSLTTTSIFRTQPTITTHTTSRNPPPIPLFTPKPVDPTPPANLSSTSAAATLPLTNLSYCVRRTPTNGLPVYLLKKRGGNLLLTRIRRIEGDTQAMMRDLTVALGLDKPVAKRGLSRGSKSERAQAKLAAEAPVKRIWINPVTGHIIVRGHMLGEISKFLTDRSF